MERGCCRKSRSCTPIQSEVSRKLDRGQVDNNVGGLALAAPCTAAAAAVVLGMPPGRQTGRPTFDGQQTAAAVIAAVAAVAK